MVSVLRVLAALILALFACGCQSIGIQAPHELSAIITAEDARNSTNNELDALTAFANAAELHLPEPGSPGWFAVTEAGFNYIDEKCDAYITDLFIANREKDKIKGFAVLADKTSNAIMLASGVGRTAMAIVAQSFGFAEGATDLVANSYLYQIDPSRIQLVVASMRRAYRQGFYSKRDSILYPTLAYHHIQKYLELCLPQTIEARINDVLGRTQAFADLSAGGDQIDILLGTALPLTQKAAAEAQQIPPVKPSPSPKVVVVRQDPSPTPAPAPAQSTCSDLQRDYLKNGENLATNNSVVTADYLKMKQMKCVIPPLPRS